VTSPIFRPAFALCPSDVGIILSYLCASGCRHCLYNCGPGWPAEPMSPETLRAALEAVTLWPSPPQIHLTGGEPCLHFPLLLQGVRWASDLGLTCYVETSGSWCRDEDTAIDRFRQLRDAGLAAVLVSCSPFHAEHIPPARTLTALRSAVDVLGPDRVIAYLPEYVRLLESLDPDRLTPLDRYEAELGRDGAARLLWHGYGIIPGGRSGYHLGHLVAAQPAAAFAADTCAGEMLYAPHSHLDLYGNYIPSFCGGLRVGDWRAMPELLDDFQAGRYPPLIRLLVERGPYGLYEMAREAYGFAQRPEGYAGKCHLCVDVRRQLVARGEHGELQPRAYYDHF